MVVSGSQAPDGAARVVITPYQREVQCFNEDLVGLATLEMVLIPGGKFMMGSPADEEDRYGDEGPQHPVNVPALFLGRYPVTQAQWRVIAKLNPVDRDLEPEPSHFKGDRRPVEQVSWEDAVEYCQRLKYYTGRSYRLPSEAEWEYACRAGTTTPFHFGETITTDYANYRGIDWEEEGWSGSYGKGPKGIYREQTTPVDEFSVTNRFGLSDMHGNVWEWCQDHWHEHYEGAPIDGSAWSNENDNRSHVIRGGSWANGPGLCRSAARGRLDPVGRDGNIGFRVALSAPGFS